MSNEVNNKKVGNCVPLNGYTSYPLQVLRTQQGYEIYQKQSIFDYQAIVCLKMHVFIAKVYIHDFSKQKKSKY